MCRFTCERVNRRDSGVKTAHAPRGLALHIRNTGYNFRDMRRTVAIRKSIALLVLLCSSSIAQTQKYSAPDGKVRVALIKQPYSPTGTSVGPNTMANGGIQQILSSIGVNTRIEEVKLTPDEATEYGGWKKLGMALGHFSDIVAQNERDGYFVVGLLATCPSMPGLVAGLQHSGPTREPIKIGMLVARRAS